MSEKILSAGDEVDSYCTTCKLVLAHQIVALVDETPDKVICKTCGKQHKYRPNPPKSLRAKTEKTASRISSTPRKKTAKPRKAKDMTAKWEETLAEHNVESPKAYSMSGAFEQHDVITHQKFGRGIVTEVREEGKMEVLFKEGSKVLVFGQEK
ncbi:hypothetical protein U27_01682 [Candidatus Vecturithrix granuli]|uniref:Uncharacterized protein n=1 Tax=Vecturithrix granuli TaxID=1499967 RepID=A0A0S6W9T0_VECG1|nr:hypothetical protein U27_01682 [Candidatus Vecturithrix granuli]